MCWSLSFIPFKDLDVGDIFSRNNCSCGGQGINIIYICLLYFFTAGKSPAPALHWGPDSKQL